MFHAEGHIRRGRKEFVCEMRERCSGILYLELNYDLDKRSVGILGVN